MTGVEPAERRNHRPAFAIELLRIGVGIIWALNFVFIVAPANQYFGHFGQTALSFAPTTLGGPAFAQFVAAHALFFSWVIAVITGYLAVALILGITTRWACLVGGLFSAVLLGVQVGSTFVFPGGTDIGEHPLYLLIYVGLVVGGAGSAYSLDLWIVTAWARRRAVRAAVTGAPRPRGIALLGLNYRFFVVYFVAGILITFGITAGLIVAIPPGSPATSGSSAVSYENLTVSINASNGWPQYTPANFTVPTGLITFTITDRDAAMNWPGCGCVVTGTQGGTEQVNGTAAHIIPSSNVAHTFNVPSLGISAFTPGGSVVRFTVDLINAGTFQWFCMAPCGAGANPYSTPPMGTPGFMTGTMTIG